MFYILIQIQVAYRKDKQILHKKPAKNMQKKMGGWKSHIGDGAQDILDNLSARGKAKETRLDPYPE